MFMFRSLEGFRMKPKRWRRDGLLNWRRLVDRLGKSVATLGVVGILGAGAAVIAPVVSANTGNVRVVNSCSGFTAAAYLDNNVDHRWIVVTWPSSTVDVIDAVYTTTSETENYAQNNPIWTTSGTWPNSGTATLTIYKGSTTSSGVEISYQESAIAPLNCAALTITKVADAPAVSAGSQIGFTITLSNAGPGQSTGATLSDPLPGGAGIFWSIASQSGPATCTITGTVPNQELGCSSFTLTASGADATEAVHVTSPTTSASCATYDNKATYTSSNAPGGSASAQETVTCLPPAPPTPNTPALTTVPSPGGPVGTVLSDTAQVTGIVNPATTDNVSFALYSDSSCTTLADNLGSAPVIGPTTTNGVATWTASSPGSGYAPAVAATYYWGVEFDAGQDPANLSSSLLCGEPVTITLASGTQGAHTTTPAGAVKAASTPAPNTGADLLLPGLLAALALLFGGLLLMTGVRIRRNPGL